MHSIPRNTAAGGPWWALCLLISLWLGGAVVAETSPAYLLHPDGHGDTIVVEHNNRIWVRTGPGIPARRLTDAQVEETTPAISPNGEEVAYVSDAGLHLEVFVTRIDTGATERLTYEGGFSVEVQGWLSDTEILFSSIGKAGKRGPSLFAVNRTDGTVRVIPLLEASEGCMLNEDFVFVKNQPLLDSIRLYEGGYAQTIYRIAANLVATSDFIDTGTSPSKNLTADYDGISRNPVCLDGRIYFLSDRSGRFNVWSMDRNGQDLHQHTRSEDLDIRTMSAASDGAIVFSMIGKVYRLDTKTDRVTSVSIDLPADAAPQLDRITLSALSSEEFVITDDARLAVLVIRGRLWAIDIESQQAACLDCDSGHRIRAIQMSTDGTTVYGLRDASGEFALVAYDARGMSSPRLIDTTGIDAPLQDFVVSPSGGDILLRTVGGALHHLDVARGGMRKIDLVSRTRPEEISWSHDGRYAVFVTFNELDIGRVTVYDARCHNVRYLTSGRHEVSSPIFAPGDREILLIADVNFRSSVNDTWAPTTYWPSLEARSVIHSIHFDGAAAEGAAVAIAANETAVVPQAACPAPPAASDPARGRPLLQELPYVAGIYSRLATRDDTLLAFAKAAKRDSFGQINSFPLNHKGPRIGTFAPIADTIDYFSYSPQASAIIGLGPRGMFTARINPDGTISEPDFALSRFSPQIEIDRAAEQAQMFRDLWRLYRDHFWDAGMAGVDWAAQYDRYRPYLTGVSNRAEFNDLVFYMVGALGAGHTSLARDAVSGDRTQAIASLGADVMESDRAVFVTKIFDGDLDIAEQRSPLTEVSPPVNVGDRIVALNGAPVLTVRSLRRMMTGRVGEEVLLDVETSDGISYRHRVTLISTADEEWLRAKDWAADNADLTDRLSGGRVGYIHMPAAYADDFTEFVRQYTYLHQRDALILDLRGNSGGNIDPWLLHFLQRRTWLMVQDRYDTRALKHPREAFSGKLFVLIDGDTYSDGELIAEGVRQLDLGILVGTRTTGAGIWVNDDRRLVDGARVRIPVSSSYLVSDPDRALIIEGRGVEPDIVIENDPYRFFHGRDDQLLGVIDLALDDG